MGKMKIAVNPIEKRFSGVFILLMAFIQKSTPAIQKKTKMQTLA
jgi:hypothetical protein